MASAAATGPSASARNSRSSPSGLREVARLGPGLQREADGPGVAAGIDAAPVEAAGAADGEDDVVREDGLEARHVGGGVREDGADGGAVRDEELDRDAVLHHLDAAPEDLARQGGAHVARGVGAGARGAADGGMVGLVADVAAEGVVREADAKRDELREGDGRKRGLDEGDVAVDGAAGGDFARHEDGRVGLGAVQGELVVGLLVAARVGRRAAGEPLGVNRGADAERVEPHGRREARGAGADHERLDAGHRAAPRFAGRGPTEERSIGRKPRRSAGEPAARV